MSALLLLLSNCKQNSLLEEVKKINENGDVSLLLSRENSFIIRRTYNITDNNTKDSIPIFLTNGDWDKLSKSYNNNKVESVNEKKDNIGKYVNSIEQPVKFFIKSNDKNIAITYNYFLDNTKSIDKEKTKNIENFMKVVDSIANIKSLKK